MAETCWYNSKRMRLDDGCNNNVNGTTVKENEKWSCSGDTSLVEPEILEDMGVSMLTDGEASRESLQTLKTQECTISPKNFDHVKTANIVYESLESSKSNNFEQVNLDRLESFENEDDANFSTVNNESGYSSRVENENFAETKENFNKEDSNDAAEITGSDAFYFLRRKKKISVIGEDKFNILSDEIILMILKWLPKKYLVRSMLVCKRWCQIARDEALWTRLDLGGKVLNAGTLGHILPRGVQILRLAQAEIAHPAFISNSDISFENYISKLQYLDLSMTVVSVDDLTNILKKCKYLKKLSLEKCSLNAESCVAISENQNLEILNLTMCDGMNLKSVKNIVKLCKLTSLNVGWCDFDSESMEYLCKMLPPSINRLNIAGCRKTLTDDNVRNLVERCPHMVELDLSDCTMLTVHTVHNLMNLNELEHLSLSRCYHIPTAMLFKLILLPNFKFLDIFTLLSEEYLKSFISKCHQVGINNFPYSAIARPTVGVRRTSIWGQRVRD